MRVQLLRCVEHAHRGARAGENAVEAVEIALRNGVELVVVAAGARDGQAEECLGHRVNLAVHHDDFLALHIHGRLVELDQSPPRRREQRLVQLAGPARLLQQVAGDLLTQELVVGQVAVERADEPDAVAPGVRQEGVVLRAVRVGVADHVLPVAGEALAEVGGGEERINAMLDARCWMLVELADDHLGFLLRRRKTREDEVQSSGERTWFDGRGRGEAALLQLREQETVNGVGAPRRVLRRRDGRAGDRAEGPVGLGLLGRGGVESERGEQRQHEHEGSSVLAGTRSHSRSEQDGDGDFKRQCRRLAEPCCARMIRRGFELL